MRHSGILRAWAWAALAIGPAAQAADKGWQVAGNLGMMQLVVVDAVRVTDEDLYRDAIDRLCPDNRTCFLRFYTNSKGAKLAVPLPDEIAGEPAALYSRSSKQGKATFQWSCRVRNQPGCF